MESLLPFWPHLSAAALVAAAVGYALRVLQEHYAQARLGQVLLGLGGELPDWEKRARALEDDADRAELADDDYRAGKDREAARRMRRVAKRRLRRGKVALP